MILHQKQSEFVSSRKRYKLLNWGRRSGKTFAIGYDVYPDLWNTDDARVAYYAPNRDDARDIAWEEFKEVFKEITLNANETLLELRVQNKHYGKEGKKGTSLLKLYGWEAVKNSDKGRGVENNVVVLDEAAFYPQFKEKFEKVIEPTLLTSKGRLVVTSTPNGFNHFHAMAQHAQRSDEWFYSHATSYDNPHNDPAELEKLKSEKPEDSFSQEYLADFRRISGLVYKEFDPNRHVLDRLPERITLADNPRILNTSRVERRGCLDFGFKNPAAMYTILKDNEGTYYITDELYETGKLHEELADLAVARGVREWYPDPADAEGCAHLRRKGLQVKEVSKDIKAGIQTVQSLFKQNRLFIVGCPNLVFELNQYRYREQGKSRVDLNEPELPVKEHDHGLDASRYCLHMWETVGGADSSLDDYYASIPVSRTGAFRA